MRVWVIRSDFCRLLRCNEIPEQRSSASEILSRLPQIGLPGGNIRPEVPAVPHTAAAQHALKCVSRFIDTFCASGSNFKSCKSAQVTQIGNRESHRFDIDGSRYVYSRDTDGQEEEGNAPWLFRLDPAASVRRFTPPFVNCVASQSLRTHSRLPGPPHLAPHGNS